MWIQSYLQLRHSAGRQREPVGEKGQVRGSSPRWEPGEEDPPWQDSSDVWKEPEASLSIFIHWTKPVCLERQLCSKRDFPIPDALLASQVKGTQVLPEEELLNDCL